MSMVEIWVYYGHPQKFGYPKIWQLLILDTSFQILAKTMGKTDRSRSQRDFKFLLLYLFLPYLGLIMTSEGNRNFVKPLPNPTWEGFQISIVVPFSAIFSERNQNPVKNTA